MSRLYPAVAALPDVGESSAQVLRLSLWRRPEGGSTNCPEYAWILSPVIQLRWPSEVRWKTAKWSYVISFGSERLHRLD